MVMSHQTFDESQYNLNCRPWSTHGECNGRVYSLATEAVMDCACECHSGWIPNIPSELDPVIPAGQNTE